MQLDGRAEEDPPRAGLGHQVAEAGEEEAEDVGGAGAGGRCGEGSGTVQVWGGDSFKSRKGT